MLRALEQRFFPADGLADELRAQRRVPLGVVVLAAVAMLGVAGGLAVAAAGLNALFLATSLVACGFILFDFRIGVVLLVLLLPISRSAVFPHAMLGVTGLNPFNLLLAGTFASYLLASLLDGGIRRFVPRPLLWLYVVPIVAAGALGVRHVAEIAPGFFIYGMLDFKDAGGYLREMVVKPLLLVMFALLVGAATARSARPERFIVPALVSVWLMGALVLVFVARSGVDVGSLASANSRGFLSALGLHANDLGRLYAVAYALLLFSWAESREPGLRLALLASMAVVVVALTLTFSRGAFFGFIVVNGLFVLWRLNARTLVFAALLLAGALLLLPDAVYERMSTGFGSGLNAISAGRIDGIWLPLVPDLLRSPLYGNGLGSILWSKAMYMANGGAILGVTHPHNAYLQAFLDMGAIGLLLLCAYFHHVWRGFRRLGAEPSLHPTLRGFFQGAAAGLLSFLIAGVSDSSLTPVSEQAFLWLAIGMMYGQLQRQGARERPR